MPGLPSRRRRRQVDDDDDEGAEDSHVERSSSFQETSQHETPRSQAAGESGNKRRRLTAETEELQNGADGDEQDEDENAEEDSTSYSEPELPPPRPVMNGDARDSRTLSRTPKPSRFDEHKFGAIVRIKLTNFVTYANAEFFPGPRLNLVIGPNGTGKSTLVCAICLGLGYGPQLLGRARDVAEFVKHGCDEARIEIELKTDGKLFRSNPVVTRIIKNNGSKSSFLINGKTSNNRNILKLCAAFSIQCDNLCQFLPQDRVVEFAGMSTVELLASTQRAVADPEMLKFHETLIDLRKEQKRILADNRGQRETLANLENRQNMQRADVEMMQQREHIKKKVGYLKMLEPLLEYKEAMAKRDAAKEVRIRAQAELQRKTREVEPMLRRVNAKQEYANQVSQIVKQQRGLFQKNADQARRLDERLVQLGDEANELLASNQKIRDDHNTRKLDMQKHKTDIAKFEELIKDEPAAPDATEYNVKIRERLNEMREAEQQLQDLAEQHRRYVVDVESKKREMQRTERQLQQLDSQAGRQEEVLKRASPNTYQAWQWIKENRDKFQMEVFGPMIVECQIAKLDYASAVESLLQRSDALTIVVQCQQDFKKLSNQIYKEMDLHDVSFRVSSQSVAQFNPPTSQDNIEALGFEYFAKDLIQGPAPVLAFLCGEKRFHQTPITKRDITDAQYARIEATELTSYVAGRNSYMTTRRREYGPGASSTRVRQLRQATFWTNAPTDPSIKRELEEQLQRLATEIAELENRIANDRVKHIKFKEVYAQAKQDRDALEREKLEKQNAYNRWKGLPTKKGKLVPGNHSRAPNNNLQNKLSKG